MNNDATKQMINSGNPYDDMDPGVEKARAHAIRECRRYNYLVNSENRYEVSILKELLGSIGEDVYIESNFLCEFGFNVFIGNNVYINHDLILLDCNRITIGNGVYIAPRVGMYGANHAEDPVERAEDHIVYSKPIVIGDRVWLGAGVHVLQGVTIGENTIIGAGSVVTKDIPANVIAAGNPCKVIRAVRASDRKGEGSPKQ